jgi:hypothetical protein
MGLGYNILVMITTFLKKGPSEFPHKPRMYAFDTLVQIASRIRV